MPMRFKLNFELETSQERLQYLKDTVDFTQLTKKDIETCTDYVLYGKDPEKNNTSVVDRKEVYIKTRYSSYSQSEPVSLEALMESPTFDETIFRKEKNIYKKVKPESISQNRDKYKDIPGMKELWEAIDTLDRRLKLAKGEVQPEPGETVPQLDSKHQQYHCEGRLLLAQALQRLLCPMLESLFLVR